MAENSCPIEADAQQQPPLPPDSAPAVLSAPIPVEKSDISQPELDVHPPSVITDEIPIPCAATAPVPSPNPHDSIQPFPYKNHLHKYTQQSRIPVPVYQTVNEGSKVVRTYRSTVVVDEICYVSPNTFRNRKEAEQDAARIALEYISKKTKDDGFLLLHEDLMVCKSILSEYMVKMNLTAKPIYETKQHKSSVPSFQSTLVLNGVVYTSEVSRSKKEADQVAARAAILSLLGDAGNPKSQKILTEIIASKVRFHATLRKLKESHPSLIQPKPIPENTEEHVAVTVNEDKEVKDAILVNGVASGAISEVPSSMSHFRPEFRSTKPVASFAPVRLPIEFVPSTLEEPVGDCATGSEKRSTNKNKMEARKRLCVENRMATDASQTDPPCSLAQ